MEQTYMKEKPILPLLLSMAAPMILSMLVNIFYGKNCACISDVR